MRRGQSLLIILSLVCCGWFFCGLNYAQAATTSTAASVNISATVIEWSTSTPPTPTPTSTPPTEPPHGGGGVVVTPPVVDHTPPEVLSFKISDITKNSVEFEWNTNEPVSCFVNFGLTPENLDKSLGTTEFTKHCEVKLTGLETDTRYYFMVISTDPAGNQITTKSFFRTALATLPSGMPDVIKVENPKNFKINSDDSGFVLSWDKLEKNDDFKILILRSLDFFPTNEQDGQLMYLGKPPSLLDGRHIYRDTVEIYRGQIYFYTLIIIDNQGHRSSGVINSAKIDLEDSINEVIELKTGIKPIRKPWITPEKIVTPERILEDLSMKDVDYAIDGARLDIGNINAIIVPSDTMIAVMISKIKLRHKVDRIIVEVRNESTNQLVNLEYRPENNYYVGNIGPFAPGNYDINIGLYGKQNQLIKIIDGRLVVKPAKKSVFQSTVFPSFETRSQKYLSLGIFIIILMFILYLIFRKKKNKDNQIE